MLIWNVLNAGKNAAIENMERDEQLLNQLHPDDRPIIHFYDWKRPSITYGYFLKPEELLSQEILESGEIELAKRPTGGGMVFHLTDLTFSLLIPRHYPAYSENVLENYRYAHDRVLFAVQNFLQEAGGLQLLTFEEERERHPDAARFCFAKPTQYDVLLKGKKIAGAAQRKKKQGFLHQGSISLGLPDYAFIERALRAPQVVENMKRESAACLRVEGEALERAKEKMRNHLQKSFQEL